MPTRRIPRKIFYLLWVDETPIPAMRSMCFPEELAKDLAVGVSKKAQRDVFILKATHVTYAKSLEDITVKELTEKDLWKKDSMTQTSMTTLRRSNTMKLKLPLRKAKLPTGCKWEDLCTH